MAATVRLMTEAEEREQERKQFWQIICVGGAALFLALLAMVAGIHHVGRDRETLTKLRDAQYRVQQLEGIVEVGQRFNAMSVKVATVPPSDYSYDLVMVPRPGGAR